MDINNISKRQPKGESFFSPKNFALGKFLYIDCIFVAI